jgi:hypothetical protein
MMDWLALTKEEEAEAEVLREMLSGSQKVPLTLVRIHLLIQIGIFRC